MSERRFTMPRSKNCNLRLYLYYYYIDKSQVDIPTDIFLLSYKIIKNPAINRVVGECEMLLSIISEDYSFTYNILYETFSQKSILPHNDALITNTPRGKNSLQAPHRLRFTASTTRIAYVSVRQWYFA